MLALSISAISAPPTDIGSTLTQTEINTINFDTWDFNTTLQSERIDNTGYHVVHNYTVVKPSGSNYSLALEQNEFTITNDEWQTCLDANTKLSWENAVEACKSPFLTEFSNQEATFENTKIGIMKSYQTGVTPGG